MRKEIIFLKKIIIWLMAMYISLFIFFVLVEITTNIGVKKPYNGVIFSEKSEKAFSPSEWVEITKEKEFNKEFNPVKNWENPPSWANKPDW